MPKVQKLRKVAVMRTGSTGYTQEQVQQWREEKRQAEERWAREAEEKRKAEKRKRKVAMMHTGPVKKYSKKQIWQWQEERLAYWNELEARADEEEERRQRSEPPRRRARPVISPDTSDSDSE